MKRAISFLGIAFLIATAPLWATGTTEMEDEGPPRVTMLVPSDQPPAPGNAVLTEIEERTGIVFEPSYVPQEQQTEKRNALIASGDLPDLISAPTDEYLRFVDNDILLGLSDLFEEHGEVILENRTSFYTQFPGVVDGEIYGVPQGESHSSVLAVRKDWLDTLGMPVPATLDEYYETLVAFTNDDPDGDGEDNTFGMAATYTWTNTFSHVFGAYGIPFDGNVFVDGRVIPALMHPDFLDAIRYLRRLHRQGLMEQNFATIQPLPAFEKLWTGQAGSFTFMPVGTTNNWLGRYTEEPKPEFAYAVLEGPDGDKGTVKGSPFSTVWVSVTEDASNPEAAVQLLNFLNTMEGSMLSLHGIEDVHYALNEAGQPEYLDPYTDSATHRKEGAFVYAFIAPHLTSGLKSAAVIQFNETTQEGYRLGNEHALEQAFVVEQPEVIQDVGSTLNDIRLEAAMRLIVVPEDDLESEYDGYVQSFLDAGGQEWIEQSTEIYEREQNIN